METDKEADIKVSRRSDANIGWSLLALPGQA